MKKKGTSLIGMIVILLALGTIAVFYYNQNQSSTLEPALKDFSVKQPKKTVDKIFIADNDGNTILLEKQKDGIWMLNGKYKAQQHSVELLLETIKKIKVKSPVSRSMRETVMRNIVAKNKKVEIYQGDDEASKIYYLGTATKNHNGAFMLLETPEHGRSSKPFITHIPGNHGYLTPRFFTSENEWRFTGVFNYDPRNIREVIVKHIKQPEHSFSIKTEGGKNIRLQRLTNNEKVTKFDTGRVKQYLLNFKKIHVETYRTNLSEHKKDSILNSRPVYEISVTDDKGKVKTVQAYHMAAQEGAVDVEGNPLEHQLDKMWGYVDGQEMAIIQNFVFDRLFQPVDEFIQPSRRPGDPLSQPPSPAS